MHIIKVGDIMEKKTIADIIKEYKNRQDNPEHEWIGVLEDVGQYEQHENVSNLKTTKDEHGEWLEFDTNNRYGKSHIKVHGHVVKYKTSINE